VNQLSCRYNQQNLQNRTEDRPTDMCNYKAGFHFRLNDTNLYSTCDSKTPISLSNFAPWKWPDNLLQNSKYISTDPVAQKECDHYVALNLSISGGFVQFDVWTTNDTGFPCLMSIFEHNTFPRTIITWSFDGFSDVIPDGARLCTAPEVVCDKPDWRCNAIPGTDQDDLGAALQWVCGQIDCDPLNPGNPIFQPNTVFDHSNWAFNQYFQRYKALYGEDACYFSGNAKLEPPTIPLKRFTNVKKSQPHTKFWSKTLDHFMKEQFSILYPADLLCA